MIGDPYLISSWRKGKIELHGHDLENEGFTCRYDLLMQLVEIKTDLGIKTLDCSKIKKITISDSANIVLVGGKEFELNGSPIVGLLEVLVDDTVPLLKRHLVTVKNPDYNPALNAGRRDTRILKQTKLYFAQGKSLVTIKNKKRLLQLLGEKSLLVDSYMIRIIYIYQMKVIA